MQNWWTMFNTLLQDEWEPMPFDGSRLCVEVPGANEKNLTVTQDDDVVRLTWPTGSGNRTATYRIREHDVEEVAVADGVAVLKLKKAMQAREIPVKAG